VSIVTGHLALHSHLRTKHSNFLYASLARSIFGPSPNARVEGLVLHIHIYADMRIHALQLVANEDNRDLHMP
jgi:hypothetical protein